MDLAFTPEQDELVRTLRQFARRELAPRSAQWDRTGEFPWEAWRQMGELGLLGLRVPDARTAGQDADFAHLRHRDGGDRRAATSAAPTGSSSRAWPARSWGGAATEEIKTPAGCRRPRRGEAVVALALTEPGAGSDAANLACRAERDGDGYVITGEKSGISLGMAAQAAIVFARTDPAGGRAGCTAFLVPLDLPGVSRSPLRDMGTRAIGRAVLAFDHVRVPASHRLGEEGTGFYQVMQGFDYNRIGIALACLGVAQQSVEETMAYVKERKAFGRAARALRGRVVPDRGGGHASRGLPLALLPGALARGPGAALHQGIGDDQVVGRRGWRSTRSTSACCSTATTATPTSCRSSSACATSSGSRSATAPPRS